ncbi:MAG: hypothetical protein MAG453_01705 [Calditrichaeota bacterium]|nr:hypothetical protein [Calditrichota bacterium]
MAPLLLATMVRVATAAKLLAAGIRSTPVVASAETEIGRAAMQMLRLMDAASTRFATTVMDASIKAGQSIAETSLELARRFAGLGG